MPLFAFTRNETMEKYIITSSSTTNSLIMGHKFVGPEKEQKKNAIEKVEQCVDSMSKQKLARIICI